MSFWVRLAGLMGASAVAASAFGSHGVQPRLAKREDLDDDKKQKMVRTFQVGAQQHLLHSAVLLAMPLAGRPAVSGSLFLLGTLIFSGACYAAVLVDERWGKVAPIGGTILIVAWLSLLVL